MRIAVIGSGVSGIAAAKTLARFGHSVIVFERSGAVGGVWAKTYPGVSLQSTWLEYRYSDFDWPVKPDINPTAEQVRAYIEAAVRHFALDVKLNHPVTAMAETETGWRLSFDTPDGPREDAFDYVVIGTGHHTKDRAELVLPNRDRFGGEVLLPSDVESYERFAGKTLAVVGLGKTAVDIAAHASKHARVVHNIFRAPRWLIPMRFFGRPMTRMMATRSSAMLQESWVSSPAQQKLQRRMGASLATYWRVIGALMKFNSGYWRPGRSAAARARLALLNPEDSVTSQFRGTMAPRAYYPAVAAGRIIPHRGTIASFTADGVRLSDGSEIAADSVVLAVGNAVPTFPFLPAAYRELLESGPDGAQLYRHAIHPRIPRLAFVGFNHCIFHVIASEIVATWVGAVLDGGLQLPTPEEMEANTNVVAEWKQANVGFDTLRAYTVANHFHGYFDTLLGDLGINPHRKPKLLDGYMAYRATDYAGIIDDYVRSRRGGAAPRHPLPLAT